MSAAIAQELVQRISFIELDARSRARSLLDPGSMRELLGPFDRIVSPWLPEQGVVPQSDDGVIVAKGTLDGNPAVVLAIEGAFQGGSLGEVGGAKIAGALELAAADNRRGIPTCAVILFETGGVRLQEANLGLAAIAEIHAGIVELRRMQPVIGVIAGTVGCFGGMSIAAGLCSHLIVTQEARLGLNGPQVIEQEAGISEYDSRDRPFIWSFTGGAQRYRTGLVDDYVADSAQAIRAAVLAARAQGPTMRERSEDYERWLALLDGFDTQPQASPESIRAALGDRPLPELGGSSAAKSAISATSATSASSVTTRSIR